MNFFKRFFSSEPEEEDEDEEEQTVNVNPTPPPPPPSPAIPAEKELATIPNGTIVFGNLIKLDNMMINLADVECINFYTESRYGCELYFRSRSTAKWQIGLSSTKHLIAALAKMAASR